LANDWMCTLPNFRRKASFRRRNGPRSITATVRNVIDYSATNSLDVIQRARVRISLQGPEISTKFGRPVTIQEDCTDTFFMSLFRTARYYSSLVHSSELHLEFSGPTSVLCLWSTCYIHVLNLKEP
jgi:hypothetical protein